MRKAVGILLVLLLATLAVITTSSGVETYSSHQANLTAAYGPQITCDTSCHSPGGAYDGVDNPYIGAKTNWATGVFIGSELATGKEQWCVGCHPQL